MKVALIHNARFPIARYGGTERVVWWTAKGLQERGVDVVLAAAPGSSCPFGETVAIDFSKPVEPQLPAADIWHYFYNPGSCIDHLFLCTIGGNGKAGEEFPINTAFVSRNHAERHQAECFVYNGIDPDDYIFQENKDGSLVFLAKAAWRVKNVQGAIRLARRARRDLHILGGTRFGSSVAAWPYFRGVHWHGMLGGKPKAQFLAQASALLFPVEWNEPFGIAVIEALVSGTPVIGSRRGSLPELVPAEVGALGDSESELLQSIERLPCYSAKTCRDWALSKFHYTHMAQSYLDCYEKLGRGETLNLAAPVTKIVTSGLLPLKS